MSNDKPIECTEDFQRAVQVLRRATGRAGGECSAILTAEPEMIDEVNRQQEELNQSIREMVEIATYPVVVEPIEEGEAAKADALDMTEDEIETASNVNL